MTFENTILKLGSFISNFTEQINPNIEITFDNYAYCFLDIPTVVVGLYIIQDGLNEIHEQYYKNNGFDYTKYGIHFRTFALLHEIGHIETKPNEKELNEHMLEQKRINKSVNINKNHLKNILLEYFNLPLEKLADKWAWNYLQDNLKLVKNFDKEYRIYIKKLLNSE